MQPLPIIEQLYIYESIPLHVFQAGILFPTVMIVYTLTLKMSICFGKTGCGLDCEKRLKKTAKKAEKDCKKEKMLKKALTTT